LGIGQFNRRRSLLVVRYSIADVKKVANPQSPFSRVRIRSDPRNRDRRRQVFPPPPLTSRTIAAILVLTRAALRGVSHVRLYGSYSPRTELTVVYPARHHVDPWFGQAYSQPTRI